LDEYIHFVNMPQSLDKVYFSLAGCLLLHENILNY